MVKALEGTCFKLSIWFYNSHNVWNDLPQAAHCTGVWKNKTYSY